MLLTQLRKLCQIKAKLQYSCQTKARLWYSCQIKAKLQYICQIKAKFWCSCQVLTVNEEMKARERKHDEEIWSSVDKYSGQPSKAID